MAANKHNIIKIIEQMLFWYFVVNCSNFLILCSVIVIGTIISVQQPNKKKNTHI